MRKLLLFGIVVLSVFMATEEAKCSLIGRWHFDEGSGNIAYDDSGNAKHLTIPTSAVNCWTTGVQNGAFRGDANNIAYISGLYTNYTYDLTITAWIKRNGEQTMAGWPDYGVAIVAHHETNGVVWLFCRDDTNTLGYRYGRFGVEAGLDWETGLVIPDNEWVFVAMVVNNNITKLYIGKNGQLYSAQSNNAYISAKLNSYFVVGSSGRFAGDRRFDGCIDELTIYNNALSDTEISTMFFGTNQPPVVDAGDDMVTDVNTTKLDGSVSDDGKPPSPGYVTTTWSKVSGPGTVTFDPNEYVLDPNVSFSEYGVYELMLDANDGQYEANDTVIITYKQNDPPTVNAGQDRVIIETVDGNSVNLNGQVNDDGLPSNPGYVTTTWSKVSGPGTVVFDPNEYVLDPDVSFSEYGDYELMLTADDSEFDANDTLIVNYKKNICDGVISGDLDSDCEVGFKDLLEFTDYWLDNTCEAPDCKADIDGIPGVIMTDFAHISDNWKKQLRYRLNTDDTALEIFSIGQATFINKLANTTENYNWIAGNKEITLPTTAWIGVSQYTLNWQTQSVNPQTGIDVNTLTITFTNQSPLLEAKSIWSAHPGPGPIQHRIEIKNTDTQAVQIDYTPSLDLDLSLPQETVKHWWVEKGSHIPTDYGTNITTINDAFSYIGLCTPYDVSAEEGDTESIRNEPVPWQCIHATASNHGLYTGIESSACITQQVDAVGDSNTVKLTLGIDQTLSTFHAELQPSEVYQMPPVFIGCFKGEVDDGSNRLRRWVENWLIPDKDDANLPLLVNDTWCWGLSGAMEANVKSLIDDCSSLGIDMCILDAGWYPKVGTYHKVGYWHPYATYLPNGVLGVSNYAHSKGVRMGLWSSWTLGCDLSGYGSTVLSIYGSGMTDWFSSPGPELEWNNYEWRFSNYNGAVACLAYQPPKDWITTDMLRCINDYDIDHLKHDRRVVAQTCNETNHGHLDNSGDISLRNANSFYDILDTLRAEGVIIESGTMGGRILDYGLMKHCHYTGACDSYVPTLIRRAFHDVSYAMPARVIEASYLADYQLDFNDFPVISLRYHLRSAMLGWCALVMDAGKWTASQWNDAKIQFNIYKQKIRSQIRYGDLYHISNRPSPTGWDAYQYYTPATGQGVVFVFRSESCSNSAPTVFLKGLEAAANYDVSFQDGSSSPFTATGQYLMQTGVMVPLSTAPSSELVYIDKQL